MKKVEIEIPEGKKVEWVNGVLTLVDDKPEDIKERIKTFEDALMILGNDNQAVIDYFAISRTCCADDIFAFAKLRVIAEALIRAGSLHSIKMNVSIILGSTFIAKMNGINSMRA